MFVKFAKADVLGVRSAPKRVRSASLNKFADFNEYRTDDGYVYVRVRAISSRVNKNHDGWPSEELQRAYRTFIGKPIFVDHHNSDPKKARGVVVDAQLHIEDTKTASLDPYYASEGVDPSHLPPTWIELLLEVDAKRFPKLAKAVVSGDIDGVSMGANVESSVCSHCGNRAHTPEQFCKHVISKGAYFDYTQPNGLKISKRSYENCHGVGFFEISFVFDPADETALASEIITTRRAKVAAIHHEADFLEDPGMEEMHVPDPPVGIMRGEKPLPAEGTENMNVLNWRVKQLQDAGFPPEIIEQAAMNPEIDYHDLINQVNRGATHDQAYQIYAKTASTKVAEDRNQPPLPQSMMTSAPEKVNTLRQEQICSICGSTMEDGECQVCNYVEPPEGFQNPDLSKAKETDKQIENEQAQQAAQTPPEQPLPQPPLPEGGAPGAAGSPALASFTPYFTMPITTSSSTGNVSYTSTVMGETKTSATNGRINTQERPILPATRQLTDKPIDAKTVQEAKKPVQSKTTNKENMTEIQKTADGVEPGAPEFKADKRVDVTGIGGVDSDVAADKQVDVLGVGAVSNDPLSDIDHENVEKNTGDFTAPHTDTWHGNEGDSLGQQDAVTSETGDFFTVSHIVKEYDGKFVVVEKGTGKVASTHESKEDAEAEITKLADSSADLGGPMGEGVGGASAKDGGPTWDTSDAGFPDHSPARVDLAAPLKEEVGEGTKTDPNEQYRSLKHAEPITSEDANDLGGPIGVAVAAAKAIQLKAFKLAETEIELGITDAESKYDRVAELEGHTEDALDAQLSTLAKVKTAGLKKAASAPAQKVAHRMPSLRNVTASGIDIEAHGVSDQEIEDSLW